MSDKRYHKNFVVSWDMLQRDTRELASRLVAAGPWQGIIAITRGGLVPAAILARELNIRLVDTICITSYEGQRQGELKVLKGVEGDGDGFLLVDDLVDTGKTARAVRELLPKARFVTVYAKPEGRPLVDDFITEVSQNTWIQFPWDTAAGYVEPIIEQLGKES